jgi:hypothetical protein
MTVSSTTPRIIQYNGNGATTAFSTVFKFIDEDDLVVTLTSSAGVDSTPSFTVTGGSGAIGTVTCSVAPASGETLTIRSNTQILQPVDYVENTPFPAATQEAALDKLTYICQDLSEQIGRAVIFTDTSGISEVNFPAPAASEVLRWNSTADSLETVDLATLNSIVLPSSGIVVSDGTNNLISRTLTGTANEITVTNGTGVSANPTLSLPSSITFTGKTITGGTFASPTFTTPVLGTPSSGVITNCTGSPTLTAPILGTPASGNISNCTGSPTLTNLTVTTINSQTFDQLYQRVSTQTGAVATGTTQIPLDDTIPQNTEGDEYMTVTITPKSATSKLEIRVTAVVSHSSATVIMTAALFQDSTANALAAAWANQPTGGAGHTITFTHTMTSGTTSATTFKVRIGGGGAGTTTFNGGASARLLGGVCASSIIIKEYAS